MNQGVLAKVGFNDVKGVTTVALVEIQGTIFWKSDGTVTDGMHNFLTIETSDKEGVHQKITKREQTAKGVRITTESGSRFLLSDFRYNFYGTISKE